MILRQTFKDNLIYYRKKKKLSQEKLAELSDISTNYIGDIERGNRKVTIDTIEKISKGLNIPVSILLTERKNIVIK